MSGISSPGSDRDEQNYEHRIGYRPDGTPARQNEHRIGYRPDGTPARRLDLAGRSPGGRQPEALPTDPKEVQRILKDVLGKGQAVLDAVFGQKKKKPDSAEAGDPGVIRQVDAAVRRIMAILGDSMILNAQEGTIDKSKVSEIEGLIDGIVSAIEKLGDAVEGLSALLDKLDKLLEILDKLFGGGSNLAGKLGEARRRAAESTKIEEIQAGLRRAA